MLLTIIWPLCDGNGGDRGGDVETKRAGARQEVRHRQIAQGSSPTLLPLVSDTCTKGAGFQGLADQTTGEWSDT